MTRIAIQIDHLCCDAMFAQVYLVSFFNVPEIGAQGIIHHSRTKVRGLCRRHICRLRTPREARGLGLCTWTGMFLHALGPHIDSRKRGLPSGPTSISFTGQEPLPLLPWVCVAGDNIISWQPFKNSILAYTCVHRFRRLRAFAPFFLESVFLTR